MQRPILIYAAVCVVTFAVLYVSMKPAPGTEQRATPTFDQASGQSTAKAIASALGGLEPAAGDSKPRTGNSQQK